VRSMPVMAGLPALASKPDPLMFVFLRVDTGQQVAMLRPMIAPDIGVELASWPETVKPGAVLRCQASTRERHAIIEGQTATVSDLVLNCDGDKLVVKGLDFTAHTK
jgi:hypothetical protein